MVATVLSLLMGSALAAPDNASGTYRPLGAPAAAWRVNENHTLLWNDAPFIPVGVRMDGSEQAIAAAKQAGVNDALVKLSPSADWTGTIKRLEANGFRYMIGMDGIAPGAHGYAIEPQTYRITGLSEGRKLDIPILGSDSALLMLVTARDGAIVHTSVVPTPGGRLSYDLAIPGALEHILLIYPEMTSQGHPDYWERFDEQRDSVLIALKKAGLGPGFRGVVNPMGDYVAMRDAGGFVPNGPYFRMEFRQYIEDRYRNLETAQRAWSLAVNDLASFEDMARLVPLWSGSRGIPYLWDPTTGKQYKVNNRISSVWGDIEAVVAQASARRFDRLVSAIRQIVDVPVVQDWRGWNAPYEAAKPSLTGVGIRARGTTPSEIAESAGRAASSLLRWNNKGWLLATDVDATTAADSSMFGNALGDLSAMGARGFYFRTSHPDWLVAESRSLDLSLAQWSPNPLYYPESAASPASPQRLPAGRYWLPSPGGGSRVDLGDNFFAYRYADKGTAYTAIWTSIGTGRVKLRFADPKTVKFQTLDGSDPKLKLSKNGIELTMSNVPLLITGTDEIPVPEPAFLETTAKFEELKKLAESLRRDISQEDYAFRDATLGFDRTPGGSFLQMRRAFWTATVRLAPYVWIEAEASPTHNFSEVLQVPGACSGAVLSLSSPSSLDPRGFFAEYTIPVKAEEVDVWVSARISPEARRSLRMSVGGQDLAAVDEPIRPYGQGFAWYHLGSTVLKGPSMKIMLQVVGESSNDVWVDAILVTPSSFQPKGPLPPQVLGGG